MIKRLFDLTTSGLALVFLSPFLVLVAMTIKISDWGPVFYRGERVGFGLKSFRIFKFRSMVMNADSTGVNSTAEDDPRITGVGKWLRGRKLDELPQLINVFFGDMSLVGPRPEVGQAVARYNKQQKKVFSVRPGMTDFASIRFRNEGDILKGSKDPDKAYREKIFPEKMRLQLSYLKKPSLFKDIRIILATVWSLAGGDPERIVSFP